MVSIDKKIVFVSHSPSKNTQILSNTVLDVIKYNKLKLKVEIYSPLEITSNDVLKANGIIIGTIENFGYMAGATKDFFDRSYYPLLNKSEGLPIVIWVRAGHDGTGTVKQLTSIITGLKWRLVQEILVCKGEWNDSFVEECVELCLGFAIGIESNIF